MGSTVTTATFAGILHTEIRTYAINIISLITLGRLEWLPLVSINSFSETKGEIKNLNQWFKINKYLEGFIYPETPNTMYFAQIYLKWTKYEAMTVLWEKLQAG